MGEPERLPPDVRRYVHTLALLAGVSLGAAGLLQATVGLPAGTTWGWTGLTGVVFVAGFLLLSRVSFTFTWQGHRHRTVLDEVAVYQGFLALPAPLVVLLVAVAAVVEQGMMRRRGMKAVFNVSQSVLGTVVGWVFLEALLAIGSPPLLAALPAALLYPIVSTFLTAGVLSRLTGGSHKRVYETRFLTDGLVAGSVGAGAGVALAVLWTVHPVALLTLLPFVYLTHRYGVLSALADRELEVRKRLAEVGRELVGTADVRHAAERLLDAVGTVLPGCGRAELHVTDPDGQPVVVARDFEGGPAAGAAGLEAEVPGRTERLGTLRVLPRAGGGLAAVEEPLVRIVAAQAGAAIEATRALASRERARARLATYLRSAADAVLLVREGRVRYANPAAEALFGIPEDGHARVGDLFDDPDAVHPGGEEMRLAEVPATTASGDRRMVVEVHATRLPESAHERGVLMVVRDVTERKRLEAETTRQREMLAQQEKLSALGTLVAGVAHEINNPITYMRGALELAKLDVQTLAGGSTGTRRVLTSLDRLGEGVDRVERITHSLKAVARPGNGERTQGDLNAVVADVADVVGVAVPDAVRLDVRLASGRADVVANAGEMHQVVLNLAKNALEALGSQGGAVTLGTRVEDAHVVVEVADNGPGIPEEARRRIFEPFYTTKPSGTGLGLSLSLGIVEAHGGTLTVDSQVGRGTRFVVRLPRAPAQR